MVSNDNWTELAPAALEAEWWHAVYLPIPKDASPKLLYTAHWMAEYCYISAARVADGEHPLDVLNDPKRSIYGPRGEAVDHALAALHRLEQLEKIDPSLQRQSGFQPQHRDLRIKAGLSVVSPESAKDERITSLLEDHNDKRKRDEQLVSSSKDRSDRQESYASHEMELTETQRQRLDRMHDSGSNKREHSADREDGVPDFSPNDPGGGHSRGG